jgi:WS/DGAT/MGAT family acyltransferase
VSPEDRPRSTPLSPEDLSFWYADQPRQRTTMALLMLLDRRPEPQRLRASALRAVEAVPRLRQRVIDAPFDLALPRWQEDPTFDLDFHVRRYALSAPLSDEAELDALFRTLGPIYERPFDRSRPLWELIEIDLPAERSALFFRLHPAVADGVGGNAILAALSDGARAGEPLPAPESKPLGAWSEPPLAARLGWALRDRVEQDAARLGSLAGALWRAARAPGELATAARVAAALVADVGHRSDSPLRHFGRARHLGGLELAFEPLRRAKHALGGQMIDVMLTAVAGAIGQWHREQGFAGVEELLTLVPINLRPPAEQGLEAGVGNRATGIQVLLPLRIRDPRRRFREIHRRVAERKAHPAAQFFPQLAAMLAVVPRALYRTLAFSGSQAIGLIVTNVPGVPVPRFVAGAEITAAYPFAPVAPHCPVSVALYGYRDRLYVGLDADGAAVPDVADLAAKLAASFDELIAAAQRPAHARRQS